MAKTYPLKITSAVAISGELHKAGAIVPDVPEALAINLLERGKAVLAEAEPEAVAAPEPEPEAEPEGGAEKPQKGRKAK